MPNHGSSLPIRATITIAAGLLAVLGAACGNSAKSDHKPDQPHTTQSDPGRTNGLENIRVVELFATDFAFDPAQIQAQPGERIVLQFTNQGNAVHSIEFHLGNRDVALEQDLEPGARASLTFEVPETPGTYVFYCPLGDHRGRGLEGRLVVLGGE